MPFQQRTNTSCYLAIPTHGFTVVLSVFGGTPPAKPLNCKSVSDRPGALSGRRWAEPIGGTLLPASELRLALSDIIKTSLSYDSRFHLPFALILWLHFSTTKKPCLLAVSRVRKSSFDSLPAYLSCIQIRFGVTPPGIRF